MGHHIHRRQSDESQRTRLCLFGLGKRTHRTERWHAFSLVDVLVYSTVRSSEAVNASLDDVSSMRSLYQWTSISFCAHRSKGQAAATGDLGGLQPVRLRDSSLVLVRVSLSTRSETNALTRGKSRTPAGASQRETLTNGSGEKPVSPERSTSERRC